MRSRGSAVAIVAVAALGLLAAGCGRSTLKSDSAPDGGAETGFDVRQDGPGVPDVVFDIAGDTISVGDASDDGFPCGNSLTCFGTDICLTLNLCGGPVRCNDLPDGGQCPPGSTPNEICLSVTGRPGCDPGCPGNSYSCVPRPAFCAGAISCTCFGYSCGPTACTADGRSLFCANQ